MGNVFSAFHVDIECKIKQNKVSSDDWKLVVFQKIAIDMGYLSPLLTCVTFYVIPVDLLMFLWQKRLQM